MLPFKGKGEHLVFPKNHQRTAPKSFSPAGGKRSNIHSVGAKMTRLEAGKEKFKSRLPRLPAGHPSQSPGLSEPQCSPLEMARPTERLEVSNRPVNARSSAPCQVQSRHGGNRSCCHKELDSHSTHLCQHPAGRGVPLGRHK